MDLLGYLEERALWVQRELLVLLGQVDQLDNRVQLVQVVLLELVGLSGQLAHQDKEGPRDLLGAKVLSALLEIRARLDLLDRQEHLDCPVQLEIQVV